jgi:hypothetical protein
MSKPAEKSSATSTLRALDATPNIKGEPNKIKKADSESKQARVVALLASPEGATIAAMMKDTGWQQHSVRGFLAGVVRKKLKLKLHSKKIDGTRVYRIDGGRANTPTIKQSKRRAA